MTVNQVEKLLGPNFDAPPNDPHTLRTTVNFKIGIVIKVWARQVAVDGTTRPPGTTVSDLDRLLGGSRRGPGYVTFQRFHLSVNDTSPGGLPGFFLGEPESPQKASR